MTWQVDLNCDLGESFGAYRMGQDDQIIPLITSANVACGFHAGDPLVMEQTVKLIKQHQIAIGAHPGYPDLIGFGRRQMMVSQAELQAYITYQIGALAAFAKIHQLNLQHVKPHGALYNMAVKDRSLAQAICQAVAAYDDKLLILCPAASELAHAAKQTGLQIAREVFADRAYEADGSLVSRDKLGAIITDEEVALQRLIQMIQQGTVNTIDGKTIPIQADSICVHGDNRKALIFIQKIQSEFKAHDIEINNLQAIIQQRA